MTTILTPSYPGLTCLPRFGTPRSPDRPTLGPAVGKVAALLGKPFMPWQQYVMDVALEIDPETGKLVYSEIRLTVPRQSGKSTAVLAKAVHRASATQFFGPRQQIVYAAQTRKDSRKKWEEDYLEAIKASRAFKGKVVPHLGNGNEHLRFPNRSRFGIESTTEKSGHGSTLDEGYVDEAFSQPDGRVEQAFRPAMITRTNTQLWVISTAGWLDGSPYLEAKVRHGRQLIEEGGPSRGIAYFEWSAPQDADPFDRQVWRDCMPALNLIRPDGSGITEDKIAFELEAALGSPEGLNGFRRAYLNQWVPKAVTGEAVIPLSLWAELRDTSGLRPVGKVGFAVDSTPDNSATSISVAGECADGRLQVQLVDHRDGQTWAVPRVVELARKWPTCAVVIDKQSTAGSLIGDIEAAGVEVVQMTSSDAVQACSQFYNAAIDGQLRHLDQDDLNRALAGATKRELIAAWAWNRKSSEVDITPLVSATNALWGWTTRHGSGDVLQAVW
ncbi:MAG TPA: terminase family protein [Acidimicrobiales bacterium]|nr:terminase family protein [Acidimicrobiales bacterium]